MYLSTFSEIIVINLIPTRILFLITLPISNLGIEYAIQPGGSGLLVFNLLTEMDLLDIWNLNIFHDFIVFYDFDTALSQE